MPVKVIMPQLGESVEEGTITKWLKSVGEPVEEYEPLLEINTDKVDTEIPSPASGVLLTTLQAEGTVVTVGSILAWIGQQGEEIPESGQPEERVSEQAEPTPEVEPVIQPSQALPMPSPRKSPMHRPGQDRELGYISPLVARLANEHDIDLKNVPGSGLGGRITKRDVLDYIESTQAAAVSVTPAVAPVEQTPVSKDILPLTPVRQAIAEHMVMSKRTSPHVSTAMEVDLSRVVAHREVNKIQFSKRDGVNLTFTAYFVSATVTALKKYPIVNSSWSEKGIIIHPMINIGMATSLGEQGLIVPVIKDADSLSLLGIARSVNDLATRARNKKLQPDEVQGGTFTITNHGTSGSLFATPIINQPQCAILGVGAIQKRAVVISDDALGDLIAIRPMAYLTLTFDHRILDGAIADYFLGEIVTALKNWD